MASIGDRVLQSLQLDTPATVPHTANATPRSRPRKLCPSSASDVADMIAPPIPWPLRDRISISGSRATSPHSSEPSVKMIRPAWNSRFLPYLSASAPEVSSSEARVSAYASITHCTSLSPACSPPCGFEQAVLACSRPAERRELPPPGLDATDSPQVVKFFSNYWAAPAALPWAQQKWSRG